MDLAQLERKLHGYQAILWLKQSYEESEADSDESTTQDGASSPSSSSCSFDPSSPKSVSKSSVYEAYVEMCHREQRPILFTRAVVGKMVRKAFPNVRTLRRGPRGHVTQHYIGLRPLSMAAMSDVKPTTPTSSPSSSSSSAAAVNEEEDNSQAGLSGSGEWSTTSTTTTTTTATARVRTMESDPKTIWPHPQPQPQHWAVWVTSSPAPVPVPNRRSVGSGPLRRASILPSTLAAMQQRQQHPEHAGDQKEEEQEEEEGSKLTSLESHWDWRLPPAQTKWPHPDLHQPGVAEEDSVEEEEEEEDYFTTLMAWADNHHPTAPPARLMKLL